MQYEGRVLTTESLALVLDIAYLWQDGQSVSH